MFACIFVPDFAVQAALRLRPAQHMGPVAVLDGPANLPRVVALNDAARQAGIEIGMTMLQAAAVPGALLHKRVSAQEEAAQQALLDSARSFSPCVEATAADAVIADLTGAQRLLGSPQQMGCALAQLTQKLGLEAHVAIASNPDAAHIAARGFAGVTVIAAGEEAARLAPLPLDALSPSQEMLEILESWGIRNCKSLAMLPPLALTERLGQAGLHLQKLARGESRRQLVPAADELCFEETLELEDALELLEPLSFLLNRLLEQLIERLIARALATSELRLTLTLESHPDVELARGPQPQSQLEYTCAFKLPVPTQDPKLLLKLVQLELSAHPPAAAVKKILVKAEPAHPRAAQAGLFLPAAPEPEKLEVLLARLRATVGDRDQQGRALVGSPRLPDSHRPDGFEMAAFSPPAGDRNSDPPSSPRMALRRFRPPLPAQVEAREHVPQAVKFREQNFTVLAAAGPWRSSGEWWSASGWQREEWDVALAMKEGQGIYRIAWDAKVESWFVEGLYD